MSKRSKTGSVPREGFAPVDGAELYFREVGQGPPIIVLHGGPDFSHTYFLPELDRLSDSFRLIYYDQRGRGKSTAAVKPEDVTIESEMEDLDGLRRFFQLESVAVLGHSWGGVLAMEYATRRPERVSHLILLNTAPASHEDVMLLRAYWRRTAAEGREQLRAIAATPRYQSGDQEADAEYYRIHFQPALARPEHVALDGYDLVPRLARLRIPTLVLHGDHDFVPATCTERIARAIPGSRFVLLRDCGHFS